MNMALASPQFVALSAEELLLNRFISTCRRAFIYLFCFSTYQTQHICSHQILLLVFWIWVGLRSCLARQVSIKQQTNTFWFHVSFPNSLSHSWCIQLQRTAWVCHLLTNANKFHKLTVEGPWNQLLKGGGCRGGSPQRKRKGIWDCFL